MSNGEQTQRADIWGHTKRSAWQCRPLEQSVFAFHRSASMVEAIASSHKENEVGVVHDEGPERELANTSSGGRTSCIVAPCERVDGVPQWVLLCGADAQVRHNGVEMLLGLALLRDRDEVVLQRDYLQGADDCRVEVSNRFYFSTEQLAEVVAAPAGLSTKCPRCKMVLATGDLAVRCPSCGAWHHQREGRPCWTYTDRCAVCHRQETALDGQLPWTPAEL